MNTIQIGRLISPKIVIVSEMSGRGGKSVRRRLSSSSFSFAPGESFTSPAIPRRRAASLRPVGRWKPRNWLDSSSAYNFKRKSQLYPMAVVESPKYVQKNIFGEGPCVCFFPFLYVGRCEIWH